MDYEFNTTFIAFGGHLELQTYRYLYFVIMLAVYILILCSNMTIICLIWIHKNLHEPMYMFIAALLTNSILYSTSIYPKLLIDFLSEKQTVTYPICLFQCFLYYSLNGSEFLLLSVMAYDRYVSICKPLQYHTVMTKTIIAVFLSCSWLVPACQMAVPVALSANTKLCNFLLKGILCNNLLYKLHCISSAALSVYGVIVLINVTVLPVLFVLFTYAKIFIITYRSCREVKKKAAQTCIPHLLVLLNFTYLVTFDVIIVKLEYDFPNLVRLTMTLQVIVCHPLFNPIIYGLKMKEITKHLKSVFCQEKLN
ncbi:olfactory receptor 6N2-like [Kryptolebias marmoratus]|uniref:Olfactory receptor n=1 Tax=Kryptolebias marmoratus TaxID=37003 RepID=A0A3Q2ZR49_KRYMA|nr:olfactory receptor 6N2-like [Kryptolebias marmoratus]